MIDTTTETVLSLSRAARSVPGRDGKRGVSASTVWRWATRGIRGVKLETILIGGFRCTSAEALQRFFERTTAAADGTPTPVGTSAQRQRDIDRAEAELAKTGL